MSLIHRGPVTARQLAANRANARKSTGPRTPEGKACARFNRLRHGLCSEFFRPAVLEVDGGMGEYGQLLSEMVKSFHPRDAKEISVVQEIARLFWKKDRVELAQLRLLAQTQQVLAMAELRKLRGHASPLSAPRPSDGAGVGLLQSLDDDRGFQAASETLGWLLQRADKRDFSKAFAQSVRWLWGIHPSGRGKLVLEICRQLRRGARGGPVAEDSLCTALRALLLSEMARVIGAWKQSRHARPEEESPPGVSPAPRNPQWYSLLGQEAAIERDLDGQFKLLLRLRTRPCMEPLQ